MTAENKAAPIALDSDSVWASFTINGHEFEIEVYDASDALAEIDRKHRYDPNLCLKCGSAHVPSDEEFGKPDEYVCAKCGAQGREHIKISTLFLDDVAELLKTRFGVKRCARREAGKFYTAITDAVTDSQKKIGPSPESDSGSTLTPDD